MAHYYGTLKGARGEATRCGTRESGLFAVTASCSGAVETHLYERDGAAWACVTLVTWPGRGMVRVLYDGPIDG